MIRDFVNMIYMTMTFSHDTMTCVRDYWKCKSDKICGVMWDHM